MRKKHFKSFISLNAFTFVILYILALNLTGCSRLEFKKEHPRTAVAIEGAVDVAEELAENAVENYLGLPSTALDDKFDIQVFPKD